MEQKTEIKRNTKITRIDTKGKILDFSDMMDIKKKDEALKEGKIVLNFTEYDTTTNRSKGRITYYLDAAKARVVFDDILNGRFYPDAQGHYTLLNDYGGGTGSAAGHEEWPWCWRHLEITYNTKDSAGNALKTGPSIRFAFEISEGLKMELGQFSPKPGAEKTRFFIQAPTSNVRISSAAVLAYIQAKLSAWVLANTDLTE
jgi:hypothetical protein